MVSKKSAADKKSVSTPITAKKSTAKSTAKKATSSSKVSAAKVIDRQVPVKANIDPMEKVMAIKAKNDEKKASKAAKKAKKEEIKGAKAALNTSNKIVKENAKKATAKNFSETKAKAMVEEKTQKKCCICSACKDGMIAAWLRAYKNLFNFKGRTSRFEFWSFNLLNFIFAGAVVCALLVLIDKLQPTFMYMGAFALLILFILASFFIYLALSVRRLHDTGHAAWKGFFRPTIITFLLTVILSGVALVIIQNGTDILLASATSAAGVGLSLFVLIFFVCLFALFYYSTKILLFTGFYEEDEDNEFGAASYTDKSYKVKAFKYAILYYLLVGITNLISDAINSYVQGGIY